MASRPRPLPLKSLCSRTGLEVSRGSRLCPESSLHKRCSGRTHFSWRFTQRPRLPLQNSPEVSLLEWNFPGPERWRLTHHGGLDGKEGVGTQPALQGEIEGRFRNPPPSFDPRAKRQHLMTGGCWYWPAKVDPGQSAESQRSLRGAGTLPSFSCWGGAGGLWGDFGAQSSS